MGFPFSFKYPHTAYHARRENSEYPYSDYHVIDLNYILEELKKIWEYIAEITGIEFPITIDKGGTGAETAADARTNLGLGELATLNKATISKGGTGATTAAGARTNLGLGDVSTEDIVPISKGGTGASTAAGARQSLGIEETTVSFPITLEKGGTGVAAQNLAAVYAALKVLGLDFSSVQELTSGTNLNNILTAGVYKYDADSVTNDPPTNLSNYISFLIVLADPEQNITQINICGSITWLRSRLGNGNWTTWSNAITLANNTGLSVSRGGTGATSAAGARTNLGLGAVATENVTPVSKGGTGATSAAGARQNLGLGDVSTENVLPISKGGTGSDSLASAKAALEIPTIPALYSQLFSTMTDATGNALLGVNFNDRLVVNVQTTRPLTVWSLGVAAAAENKMLHFTDYTGATLANTTITFRVFWIEPTDFRT